MTEPTGNTAPHVEFTTSCLLGTTCQMNSAGTSDAQGDALKYSWTWGDGTANSTTANPTHTYAAPGSYPVTLTVTDVWGRSAFVTQTVALTEPAGNSAPTVVFAQPTCTGLSCTVSAAGSTDNDGGIRSYTWSWGDGTASTVTTTSSSSHGYTAAGSYTITLTVTDNWGRTSPPVTQQVTVT
jgi:PKD repeat protein